MGESNPGRVVRSPIDWSAAIPAPPVGDIPTKRADTSGRRATTVRLTDRARALRPDFLIPGSTAVPVEAALDEALPFRARGLLALLYSYPDDQPPTLRELRVDAREGREAIGTAVSALVDRGWVEPLYVKVRIPGDLRMAVFRRDGFRCVVCDDDADLMADHIVPESKGGLTVFENLQTLCRTCNSRKGARGEGEW